MTGAPAPLGRPRDPHLSGRVIKATIDAIAAKGVAGFTVDDIARACGASKASLYRRWTGLDQLLVDVAADLGLREGDIDWPTPGSVRGDLVAILTAATIGNRPLAELALLSALLHKPELRQPWNEGPLHRFAAALDRYQHRARDRGDLAEAPGIVRVQAAFAWLRVDAAQHGGDVTVDLVTDLVDHTLTVSAPLSRREEIDRQLPQQDAPTWMSQVPEDSGRPEVAR